jgi:DNA sulfur modification protein DndB
MGKPIQRDYLAQPSHEVEQSLKANKDHEFELNKFATISGLKGTQFGREIFTTLIPFKDLMDFLQVFPNVQRSIVKRRVGSIKNYVLGGIDAKDNLRFFSAITVTCRGHMFYSDDTKKVAIDTANSKSVMMGSIDFMLFQKLFENFEAE